MGDYLALVEVRLEKDKKLAVYCSQAGDKARAVRVMKRIRIMQAEVSGAREMMEKST